MKKQNHTPPKSAERLLSLFCKGDLLEEILGDLYEYHESLEETPAWKRNLFYWFHTLNFIRPGLVKKWSGTQKLNYYGMIRFNLKVAFRSFFR